jgi:hypothetical protein
LDIGPEGHLDERAASRRVGRRDEPAVSLRGLLDGSGQTPGLVHHSLAAVLRVRDSESGTDIGAGGVASEAFTAAYFKQIEKLAPYWDATDPNLRPFERAGGKLILWQGEADWSMTHRVTPAG